MMKENKNWSNFVYIRFFCGKCNKDHLVLFTKDLNFFTELEDGGDTTIKFCKEGQTGFSFEGIMKYRFNCDEAIYLHFKNGTFKKISKGTMVSDDYMIINKKITVIEDRE